MIDQMKKFFAPCLAIAVIPVVAQEPWDPHLKLTGGFVSGIGDSYIGQDKTYGLALAGAYPLIAKGWGVVEFGYRYMPTSSFGFGMTTIDDKSDTYYASAMFRYQFWRHGLYAQGGLRGSNSRTTRMLNYDESLERLKADREIKTGWCLAVGYRLTDRWSVELGTSSIGFKNVSGEAISGTIIEAAILIHR